MPLNTVHLVNSLKGRKSSKLKLKIIFLKTWKIDLQLEQDSTKQSGKEEFLKIFKRVQVKWAGVSGVS